MDDMLIDRLLEDLKQPDEEVRERATTELWQIWFKQKGDYGLEILKQSQECLENGEFVKAEEVLTDLIGDQPDFAEAWNRRAVLRYLIGDYEKSLADCQQAIELNPLHFGALHGMGLCQAALGNYLEAIQAFRRALEIQPHAILNQRLILECTARLS
ncbi:hypothetical protein C7B61_00575 [filamentous cyanobacterium CCP1]|jgi:tetratricopeptide (TPR) repeat protein|nr:hypothetical protein C7B76_02990 [filamentous cyanobacterium CCP2]PSB68497.1 hypothetical protein C7B61_00575 [filamentous cyanobacterium CCP1]